MQHNTQQGGNIILYIVMDLLLPCLRDQLYIGRLLKSEQLVQMVIADLVGAQGNLSHRRLSRHNRRTIEGAHWILCAASGVSVAVDDGVLAKLKDPSVPDLTRVERDSLLHLVVMPVLTVFRHQSTLGTQLWQDKFWESALAPDGDRCKDQAHLLSLVDSDGVLLDQHTRLLVDAGAVSIDTSLYDCRIDVAVRGDLAACRAKIHTIHALKGRLNLLHIRESEYGVVEREDER